MNKFFLLLIITIVSLSIEAQPTNVDCLSAIVISDVKEYCSDEQEFNNNMAGDSGEGGVFCWTGMGNDVWFSFTPLEPAVTIRVFGKAPLGSLDRPQVALYESPCTGSTDLTVSCITALTGTQNVELNVADLVIGKEYYIRLDGVNGAEGSFMLCIDTYVPIKSPESDCKDAIVLCNKDPFIVESIVGIGDIANEAINSCIRGERASVWYKWTCSKSGPLTMLFTPSNISDDLDFAVFSMPGGIDDCDNKVVERCMASGVSSTNDVNSPCYGETGLNESSIDIEEIFGCSDNSDNFAKALDMIAGESYALLVNNYSKSGFGFSIVFGGSGELLGPSAEYDLVTLDQFECDKTISFVDQSQGGADSIVSWRWNFGAGTEPSFSDDEGPHDIVYDSYGKKLIALSIETKRGCIVTKIKDIDIAPCCKDTSTLDLLADGLNIKCFGDINGEVHITGIGGAGPYKFSLDSMLFQSSPVFKGLDIGTYPVYIEDRKGCVNKTIVSIDNPEELILDLGKDIEVDIGDKVDINALVSPLDLVYEIEWFPKNNLDCYDCKNVVFSGLTDMYYWAELIDDNGCIVSDSIWIKVNIVRNIASPNIINTSANNGNQLFHISTNISVVNINYLSVYDRWGGRVFHEKNMLPGDSSNGWDGTFKGDYVLPGVYTWVANMEFVDGEIISYTGGVTVVR